MCKKIQFFVVGEQKIHCSGCEQRITNAIRRLPGVQEVRASFQTQRVVVTFDPSQLGSGQVQERLESIGYQLKVQETA